jgi:hypothetical protein
MSTHYNLNWEEFQRGVDFALKKDAILKIARSRPLSISGRPRRNRATPNVSAAPAPAPAVPAAPPQGFWGKHGDKINAAMTAASFLPLAGSFFGGDTSAPASPTLLSSLVSNLGKPNIAAAAQPAPHIHINMPSSKNILSDRPGEANSLGSPVYGDKKQLISLLEKDKYKVANFVPSFSQQLEQKAVNKIIDSLLTPSPTESANLPSKQPLDEKSLHKELFKDYIQQHPEALEILKAHKQI